MALIDRYRSPGDLPERIPLFPLRGAILLPRSELPLNVFEPRYLAMVEDAMAGGRIIGIIQPEQTAVPVESPEGRSIGLKRVGCAGRITTYQELPDGRLRIAITGIMRFVLEGEANTDKPYRIAQADYASFAADLIADESAERIDRDELMKALKAYLATRRMEADWGIMARAPLEPLVNSIATMSPFGPEEKQALLEAPTLADRAGVLIALAQMAVAGGEAAGGGRLQ